MKKDNGPKITEVVINLDSPVEINEKTYERLVLKRFKTKHLKKIPDGFFEVVGKGSENLSDADNMKIAINMIPLISALAEVDEEVIEELEFSDLFKVMEKLGPFLEACLKTGD